MAKDKDCVFCVPLANKDEEFFWEDDLFAAKWTPMPAYPGHALVIPKRHIQYFREMNDQEMRSIAKAVAAVKTKIEQTDLKEVCSKLKPISDESKKQIAVVRELLKEYNYNSPKGFNDALNDGPAAGQSVPHMHWHILPRWDGGSGIISRIRERGSTL